MKQSKTLTLDEAKQKAFGFLSYRDHAEQEIFDKLVHSGASEQDAAEVVAYLVENKYVDNAAFARSRARELFSRGKGKRAVTMDLTLKHIDPDIIEEAVAEAEPEFYGKLEEMVAKRLAGDFEYKNIQRVTAFFARRGFDYGSIKEAVNNVKENEEYEL